jgi:hypothetical protein
MTLNEIHVIGDAAPAPPPPGSHPMPGMDSVMFDALGPAATITVAPPPGLYSRIQFRIQNVALAGTWKGTPFTANLATFQGPRVNLRASMAQEVGSGDDAGTVTFTVTANPSAWFADPSPLDAATASANGTIACDDQNNMMVGFQLTQRIAGSFSLP